ncbi:SPOR domain-containing protein [Undibacterium flavidum]|uniref:SPOR domain-containing protein n=1 Tax=Undibacterium flavidum TaxID=2762297 RepID=A0ABR6YGR3_9BURK|nr:SPOR domain-containing protein [Undibacterium flavidum]MBC3875703.1 SPOR domain-containing protein [Undibacterium flavidum]
MRFSTEKNTSKFGRQSGNTLTGIIIGLVIGLSIAVVVALVINKASTPFTNKNGKSDKADVPVTQMQDPNKPLYGNKDAVSQAAKEVAATKAAESAKPADALSAAVNAAAPAAVAATPATPVSAASKPDVADDKYIYFLQIGAFKEVADAESARAKLAMIGIEANVSDKASDSGVLHRVRVGPFDSFDGMNKMRAKLSENSVETAVVRSAK